MYKHGFKICPHTLRGKCLLLFTALHAGSKINSIASRGTEVSLASAMCIRNALLTLSRPRPWSSFPFPTAMCKKKTLLERRRRKGR